MDWHTKSAKQTLKILETSKEGLSSEERGRRLKKYGKNEFDGDKKLRIISLVFSQLKSPLVLILIFAGIVAFLLEEYTNALVIVITIVINTAIGVIQEGRASKAFEKIKNSLKKMAAVMVDNEERLIDSTELVPGDIVTIRTGDQIPADSRVLEAHNLEVNEASITGEWLAVEKNNETLEEKAHPLNRANIIYMGTLVSSGWGRAVVVETGKKTEIGKIASELSDNLETPTPFQVGIKKISHAIGLIVILGIAIILTAGLIGGKSLGELFFLSIAVAVAAVPEGLPVAVTVILAVGMERMLKEGTLVRRLVATETLGSTTILLTDKTGTLTKGDMEASAIATAEEILKNQEPKSGTKFIKELPTSHIEALAIGVYTSDVIAENLGKKLEELKLHGKTTDKALFKAGLEAGLDWKKMITEHPRLDFMPFDSGRAFAASINKTDSHTRLFISGAPEVILSMSSYFNGTDQKHKLTENDFSRLEAEIKKLASEGSRVIATAFKDSDLKEFPKNYKEVIKDLVFVGFISFRDPLRKDASATIQKAKEANLKIVMITGDHKNTAKKIAEEVGLSPIKILDGQELESLTPEGLNKRIADISVFARVRPYQKSRIVAAWQQKNEAVAMTGDGVNDAPALKKAEIGIALGSGTDVAKEASDIVLLDDNLGTIVRAIEEGRVVLDNMRKVITYLLSTGFTELILIGGSLIAGLPLPILPIQILWANLVQEGFMSFAFAFEPKEKDILERNPREDSSKKLLNKEVKTLIFGIGILTDIILFALFIYLLRADYDFERIRTIMFMGLSMNAIFFAFSLKSLRRPVWEINIFSNPYLIGSLALSVFLLMGAVTFEPLLKLLQLSPVTPSELALVFGLGILDLILIESAKYYFITKKIK